MRKLDIKPPLCNEIFSLQSKYLLFEHQKTKAHKKTDTPALYSCQRIYDIALAQSSVLKPHFITSVARLTPVNPLPITLLHEHHTAKPTIYFSKT